MVEAIEKQWDIIIVGGAAAGLSAALVLARARRSVLVVDAGEPRNRFAEHMHGVLGRNGTSPMQLVADGRDEVRASGGVVIEGRVESVGGESGSFDVRLADGTDVRARRLVVATGLRDELPAIEGLAEHWGAGAVACPYCDGFEARDRRVAVIGTSAFSTHQAQMIRQWTPDVVYFTDGAGELPEPDRIAAEARGIRLDARAIRRVVGERGRLVGIETFDGALTPVDAIFVGPRMAPRDDVLVALGAARTDTPFGSWPEVDTAGRTSVDGVWAIGNVANPSALVPIAAAAGVVAATTINAELIADEIADAVRSYAPNTFSPAR